jgi:hypothetical protein
LSGVAIESYSIDLWVWNGMTALLHYQPLTMWLDCGWSRR